MKTSVRHLAGNSRGVPAGAISLCLRLALAVFWLHLVMAPISAEAGKLGPLEWRESISLSMEYNSNINTSETDPVDDFIFQGRFSVSGSWEMTRQLTLSYGFGIGYRRYLGRSGFQLDNAAIRLVPDTTFDFDIRVSDQLTFNVSNSINFLENASDIVVVNPDTGELETNLFSFERVRNRAAVSGVWSVNQRNQLSGEIWRSDVIPLSSRFDDYRRIQQGVTTTWTRSFGPSIRGGLSGSLFETRYRTDLNNSSDGRAWGPFVEWGVTDNLTLKGDIRFTRIGFDRSTQLPGVEDHFDYDAMEWGVSLNHAFNPRMSYTLEYRETSDYGFISNFRELEIASAIFAWKATRTGDAFFSASYEWGKDSGGLAPDDWERLFLAAGYSQPLWTDFEISFRVRWTDKDSRVNGRSYDQFTAYIGLVYTFPNR